MIEFTFYDNEATGVSVRHDQVTQFGGITCDGDFQVKDSISLFVRLLPYVVPHPQALSVTRKTPSDLCARGLASEFGAAADIGRFLAPRRGVKRVFVTYNGISYDDEILRTMLYRNLREPFFNSGRDNVKIDLLSVLRLVDAVCPGAIAIPEEEGRKSFRLEKVCPANGIDIEAHDAYHDSVATMRLFRLVQQRTPWAVAVAMECGSARGVEAALAKAMSGGLPVFRFTSFGKPDFAPLAIAGGDGKRKFVGIDLRNPDFPRESGRIAEQLYKPDTAFQVIASNKFPLLLTAELMHAVMAYDFPESLRDRVSEINSDEALRAACSAAVSRNTAERVNGPSSEEGIYDGFYDPADKRRIAAFHAAGDWGARAQVRFADQRLRDFSARIVLEAVGAGEARLPAEVVRQLAGDCAEALCRPFGPADARHTTVARCLAEGAGDDWVAWARERYGEHPVFGHEPSPMPPAPAAGQMAFAF